MSVAFLDHGACLVTGYVNMPESLSGLRTKYFPALLKSSAGDPDAPVELGSMPLDGDSFFAFHHEGVRQAVYSFTENDPVSGSGLFDSLLQGAHIPYSVGLALGAQTQS